MNPNLHAQNIRNGRKDFSIELERPMDPSYPSSIAAESAHNKSQFVQAEFALSWPSLESIKQSAHSEWSISSVKARIAELNVEHRQQLTKAVKYQLYEDHLACREQYQSFEDLENWSTDSIEMMKSFHRMERRIRMHQSDNFVSHLRYTQVMALKPLYERLHKLMVAEENAKAQRARRFPKTSQAWREMDTRDAKLKVAKFLLMDKKQQDEVARRELHWKENDDDINRVVLEYKSNVVFSGEVNNFVRENQTTDPRRRLA